MMKFKMHEFLPHIMTNKIWKGENWYLDHTLPALDISTLCNRKSLCLFS